MFLRAIGFIFLATVYSTAWLLALLGRLIPRRPRQRTGRIIVTGTFHNPNWYLSHVRPLSLSGVGEVILVVDRPQLALEGVRFVCPPRWAAKLFTRAGAKALWLLGAGLRYRPDLYMGYHLMPGAGSALVAGRLLGRPTCYQMTGGPTEVIGGGAGQDSGPQSWLGGGSRFLERLAIGVVRQFDLVVVRGHKAKSFLHDRGVRCEIAIITGSIVPRGDHSRRRDIDMVYVGRLAKVKQPWQFVEVLAAVRKSIPAVTGMMIGQGPLMADLRRQAQRLGVGDNIQFVGKSSDVEAILSRCKVFLLTSRSEGLSIAMAEAMAAGAVPVVADVGELADLVTDGQNGYLVTPDRIDRYAGLVVSLLKDRDLRHRCSAAAAQAAHQYCTVNMVAERWRRQLAGTIARQVEAPRTGSAEDHGRSYAPLTNRDP